MILVLLGTQDSPFPRILEETQTAIQTLNIQEEVIAQVGTTDFQSDVMTVKDYFVGEEFDQLLQKARIVITHGGAGTLFSALHLGKKIICMPRLAELGEHNESHQNELVEKLSDAGYILEAKTTILEALKEIDSFSPKPYVTQNTILEEIEKFIDEK